MYLAQLRSTGPRTLAVASGVALTASVIAASGDWRTFAPALLHNSVVAIFVGAWFWFSSPLIAEYAERLRPIGQWCFRIAGWTAVMNAGILCGMAALALMGVIPWDRYAAAFWSSFVPNTLIATICCTAYTIHEGVKYQLQYEVAQARLASLEARLRPHFLFNALNSVVALIPDNPEAAELVTLRLADLLRYSLDSENRRTVALEQELKMVTDYLEIEKTRFGARLSYSVAVPAELLPAQVPPFCLQTLAENSVKYGGGEIRIGAQNGGGNLVLSVWDSGEGFAGKQKEVPGHGLHDLRKRLAALWGRDAGLEYVRDAGGTAVLVSIPRKAAA